jgi:flavodoxin
MQRILVVYYSRTGYTRTLAGEIAAAVQCDIERLDDGRDRSGVWEYLRCAREAIKHRTIEIRPPSYDPSGYDLVVLGTPVWAGHVCSPLRSYLVAHKGRLPEVAFFCTQGGSGSQKVFRDMAMLCGKAPVASLAITDRQIDNRTHSAELGAFVKAVATAADGNARSGKGADKAVA